MIYAREIPLTYETADCPIPAIKLLVSSQLVITQNRTPTIVNPVTHRSTVAVIVYTPVCVGFLQIDYINLRDTLYSVHMVANSGMNAAITVATPTIANLRAVFTFVIDTNDVTVPVIATTNNTRSNACSTVGSVVFILLPHVL